MFLWNPNTFITANDRLSSRVDSIERLGSWNSVIGSIKLPERNDGVRELVLCSGISKTDKADVLRRVGHRGKGREGFLVRFSERFTGEEMDNENDKQQTIPNCNKYKILPDWMRIEEVRLRCGSWGCHSKVETDCQTLYLSRPPL